MRFFRSLILISSFISFSFADPSVSGNFTTGDAVNNKQSLRKVWGNFLAGYQQARNMAKGVVRQMQLTASLANSMEQNLQAWERVSRKTESLLKADIWDSNPVGLIENLEENFFQETDDLLYYQIPNAKRSSSQLNAERRAWVSGLNQLTSPTLSNPIHRSAGLQKTLSLPQASMGQVSQEKDAYAVRNAALVRSGLIRDEIIYLNDNAAANLSANAHSLRSLDDSKQNEMADIGIQNSENLRVLEQADASGTMSRVELLTHLLLSKASTYNRASLSGYMIAAPLSELSDALQRLPRSP